MRKQLTALLLVSALFLTLSGCASVRKLDAAEDRVEAKLDAAEEKLEDTIRGAVLPEKTAPAAPEGSGLLSEEQIQKIALDHAGFTAEQVTNLRTKYDPDDGIPQFDVEFSREDWEYEFEIHGETGKILSFDKEHKYD